MIKRKLSAADLLTITANLLPVYGVFFLGWSPVEVFIVYAMETFIVGIMTLLKLLVMTLSRGKDDWYNAGTTTKVSGLFFMFFFTMHFGLFALVQTSIFATSANINPPNSSLVHFFFHWPSYINHDIGIMLSAFVVSYVAQNFMPFIVTGKYKETSMMQVMFEPYGRIFIQQFTVILGSMFLAFGWGKGFIVVFAGAKLFFDLYIDFNKIISKGVNDMRKQEPGSS